VGGDGVLAGMLYVAQSCEPAVQRKRLNELEFCWMCRLAGLSFAVNG
jgi:hypothetical protein